MYLDLSSPIVLMIKSAPSKLTLQERKACKPHVPKASLASISVVQWSLTMLNMGSFGYRPGLGVIYIITHNSKPAS